MYSNQPLTRPEQLTRDALEISEEETRERGGHNRPKGKAIEHILTIATYYHNDESIEGLYEIYGKHFSFDENNNVVNWLLFKDNSIKDSIKVHLDRRLSIEGITIQVEHIYLTIYPSLIYSFLLDTIIKPKEVKLNYIKDFYGKLIK